MSGVNRVFLIGRLGADPEVRTTQAGQIVTNMSVATSEKYTTKDGEKREDTEWHRVVLFRRSAEIARDYLKKGEMVYVEGQLRTRKWTDKEGNDRWSTEIIGRNITLLGGKSDGGAPKQAQQAPADNFADEDIPF